MKINHLVVSICLSLGLVACSQPLVTKSSDTAAVMEETTAVSEKAAIEAQIKRIEAKMKTEPDVAGWLLLGDAKMHLKQYNDAVWAYREAYLLSEFAAEPRRKLRSAMYYAGLEGTTEKEARDVKK